MPKKLFQQFPKHDKELFNSTTVLLHYWVVEKHNPERVTKKFGLKQVVPPALYLSFTRVERVERMTMEYIHYEDEVIGLWEARRKNVLSEQKECQLVEV